MPNCSQCLKELEGETTMDEYERLILEIIEFQNADIVTDSGDPDLKGDEDDI